MSRHDETAKRRFTFTSIARILQSEADILDSSLKRMLKKRPEHWQTHDEMQERIERLRAASFHLLKQDEPL